MPRPKASSRLNLRPARLARYLRDQFAYRPSWRFWADIWRLVWEYKWFSLAISMVTILQEFAALWPVSLLGQFIDRLATGHLGNIVWLFFAASITYPGLVRANTMLRHKMFYETDFRKMVELVLHVSDRGESLDTETAGSAYTRAANAVSGITNTTFYVLGNLSPVVIKVAIVGAALLRYNRLLGMVYMLSLIVPGVATFVFNRWLHVLLDSQYSVASDLSGVAIRTISERDNASLRERFLEIMRNRRRVFLSLIYRSQFYLYLREAMLIGSQFAVVFLALSMRSSLHMTPGDFTRIIGYTAQVAAAFITAASCLDAIVSFSRAYNIYALAHTGAVSS